MGKMRQGSCVFLLSPSSSTLPTLVSSFPRLILFPSIYNANFLEQGAAPIAFALFLLVVCYTIAVIILLLVILFIDILGSGWLASP